MITNSFSQKSLNYLLILSLVPLTLNLSSAHPGINNYQLIEPYAQALNLQYKLTNKELRAAYKEWRQVYSLASSAINRGVAIKKDQVLLIEKLYKKLANYTLGPIVLAQYLQLKSYYDPQAVSNSTIIALRKKLASSFLKANIYVNNGLRGWWLLLSKQQKDHQLIKEYEYIKYHSKGLTSELSCLVGKSYLALNKFDQAKEIYLSLTSLNAPLNNSCIEFVTQLQNNKLFHKDQQLLEASLHLISYFNNENSSKFIESTVATAAQQKLLRFIKNFNKSNLFSYKSLDKYQFNIASRNITNLVKNSIEKTTIDSNSQFVKFLNQMEQLGLGKHRATVINIIFANSKLDEDEYLNLVNKYPTDTQVTAILRNLIAEGKYLDNWLDKLTDRTLYSNEWQYWTARNFELNGQNELATSIYQQLVDDLGFYSMLAAKRLGVAYKPIYQQHKSENLKEYLAWYVNALNELNYSQDYANMSRLWGTLEFNHQGTGFIKYAYEQHWYYQGVVASINNRQPHEIDLRFPNAFATLYTKATKGLEINTSFAQAIGRQESAYYPLATSSAKAYGLMQMIDPTANATAKKHNIPYSLNKLYDPNYNIQLGSLHLNDLYKNYNKNRALVAVAYNAGPTRVVRWRKDSLRLDQYVASIPFTETRNYVMNVLAFDYYLRYMNHSSNLELFNDNEWNHLY